MAFLRQYSAQGDPAPRRIMRAGQLHQAPVHFRRRSRVTIARGRTGRALPLLAGDPFRFRMPKFVRKLSLKKVVSGVGKLAKVALPFALPLIGGPLGAIAGSFLGGGGGREPSPEQFAPEPTGPPGQVASDYRDAEPEYEEPEYEEPEYEEPEEDMTYEDEES
jgi:hypothetical protein